MDLNNQDEFVRRVYFTIREIHTVIKNQEVPITTKNSFFLGKQAERVPRFDKILLAAKEQTRARSQCKAPEKLDRHTLFNNLRELEESGGLHKAYPAVFNIKDRKQELLRGQPFNITDYVELKDPKQTFY